MTGRMIRAFGNALVVAVALSSTDALLAQAPAAIASRKPYVVPRTPDGKPDLQGNWSNETQTPLERLTKGGATLTAEQAKAIEDRARQVAELGDKASDPNRGVPSKGGVALDLPPGERSFIETIAEFASGRVGGYNQFWLDPGEKVITIDGVPRSSIVIDPPDGRVPALTAGAKQRTAAQAQAAKQFREFDHPEVRPLADRCLLSFGSNAGPPMLPNYFYNNNYQIVQSKDHVMIMTEMVHDVRIIRMQNGPTPLQHPPKQLKQWLGDSIGRWDGDTLVVETTNFHPMQVAQIGPLSPYRNASENLKITERLTRTGPETILYRFTVEDPDTFTAPWSGELPFNRIDEQIYEYACHEGNYALSNILSGERNKERRAAESKR
jgi:hypothetical protein